MANSTSNLDLIGSSDSGKEIKVNALVDAASPATVYGRRSKTCSGLTWGYYGGTVPLPGGTTFIANGTLTLTASATNYIEADPATGLLSCNTSGFTSGYWKLYTAVAGTADVSTYTDHRYSGMLLTVLSGSATEAYVDGRFDALPWKPQVRVATTAAGTLASGFQNGATQDGVVLATGDRILIKDQAVGSENGIYVVAASGAPARATDANAGSKLVNATVYVSEGTTNADTQWTCTTNAPITVGSTALSFSQLTGGSGTSPTTTKGDMIVRSASADARLPVGADGQELVADSSQALGVKWADRVLKNYLINGNLRWWQRGQSFTALSNGSSPKYSADRWMSWVPGGGSPSYAVTRVAATLAGSAYGLKIQRTAGNSSTNNIHIGQILPASLAKALAGKTVTFALNMKSGVDFSAASSLVKLQVITGTTEDEGGSSYILDTWAGRTLVTNTNKPISTTMAQAYVTAAIPSTCKEVGFEISWAPVGTAGADDSITIELAQVTIGSVPAAFEVEGDVISLLRCQQFYRKSYNPDVAPGTVTNNGALTWASAVSATGICYGFVGNLGAPMRVTPTRTAYSPVTGASGNAYQYDAAADVAVAMGSSFNGFQSWAPTKASGDWTSGNRIGIHCVEDAELN